jgi:hypothetical protein
VQKIDIPLMAFQWAKVGFRKAFVMLDSANGYRYNVGTTFSLKRFYWCEGAFWVWGQKIYNHILSHKGGKGTSKPLAAFIFC